MVVTAVTTVTSNVKGSHAAVGYHCDNDNLSGLIHSYDNRILLRYSAGDFVIAELLRGSYTNARAHAHPSEDFTVGQAGTANSVSTTSAWRARV